MSCFLTFHKQMAAAGVRDSAADHACSHLGKAVAIATILRGTGHHAQRCFDLAAAVLLADHHLSSCFRMCSSHGCVRAARLRALCILVFYLQAYALVSLMQATILHACGLVRPSGAPSELLLGRHVRFRVSSNDSAC